LGSIALIATLALAGAVLGAGGSALAARGEVICKFVRIHGKKRVSCPKRGLRGRRGPRGKHGKNGTAGATGPQGPAGPAGAPGANGAGSGLTLNFNAKLEPLTKKTLFVGNFTVRVSAANGGGVCENVELLTGAVPGFVSVGPEKPFTAIGSFGAFALLTSDTSNMFTAVSANGSSTVSGIVGRKSAGGFCLVSGYVTGV
jgi:hypothetical protein